MSSLRRHAGVVVAALAAALAGCAHAYTVIGRSARDYAWVMARTPTMPAADYAAAVAKLEALGYPLDGLREVPQRWPENKPREDTGTADAVR